MNPKCRYRLCIHACDYVNSMAEITLTSTLHGDVDCVMGTSGIIVHFITAVLLLPGDVRIQRFEEKELSAILQQ